MKNSLQQLGLLLISLLLASYSAAYERIVSVNLCTDTLLFSLEDKENIASVSMLAADPAYSPIYDEIEGIPLNHSLIEELIQLKPDLILASKYTNLHVIFFLKQLGYNVKQIDTPFSVDGIEDTLRDLGNILGKQEKAEAIIADMQKRKAAVKSRMQGKSRPLLLSFAASGYTHGKGSMQGDLIEMAGFTNLAAKVGMQGSGYIGLEQVVYHQPDYMLAQYDESENTHSLSQRVQLHPALSSGIPNSQAIHVPSNLWACASPYMIDALELLAQAHPEF